jgi:PAS domain S-box-containing protein
MCATPVPQSLQPVAVAAVRCVAGLSHPWTVEPRPGGHDLIALVGADDVVSYASPSAGRLLGWEAEELVGRTWLGLVHPDDATLARRTLAQARAAPEARQLASLRLRSRDGEWIAFEAIARARQQSGLSSDVVVNARDVTERLRAERASRGLEARLRQSQKLETLGTLAGGIAHDFNNILQAIVGCSELAIKKLSEDSPARRYLERSLEVARRARELVRQIAQFARQGDHRSEPVALDVLVKEVCGLLRAALPATVEIHERLEERGAVVGDATQIHQLLMNLATNALQAMGDAGGILEITVERWRGERAVDGLAEGGSYLVLGVRDDGPGIPADLQDRIFEPFFTTRGVGGGTGLGLSVAHGIVRSHGGAIECESEPGRGTLFRVFLPEAAEPCARDPDAAPAPAAPLRARILFVDDDESVAYVGRSLLESLGHEVRTARDGHEALDLFREAPGAFDLVLADETMPRMTGTALAAEVRSLRPALPFVVVSGQGRAHVRSEADAGIVYLAKPFEAKELADAIDAALRRVRHRAPGRP